MQSKLLDQRLTDINLLKTYQLFTKDFLPIWVPADAIVSVSY